MNYRKLHLNQRADPEKFPINFDLEMQQITLLHLLYKSVASEHL